MEKSTAAKVFWRQCFVAAMHANTPTIPECKVQAAEEAADRALALALDRNALGDHDPDAPFVQRPAGLDDWD